MEAPKRDTQFDNLKGIMILLVVFCHFLEQFVPDWSRLGLLRALYCCIYAFHMPVFIFCSGYFSKGANSRRTISGCLVPYLTFQLLYGLLFFQHGKSLGADLLSIFNLTTPQWTLWYLLSLFFWRIFAEPFTTLRYPLFWSAVLSLYIGLTGAGSFLSLSRTFAFFPYFLAGYLLPGESLERLRGHHRSLAAGGFLLALGVIALYARMGLPVSFLRMNQSYSAAGWILWRGVLLRLGLLGIGFVCTFSLLSLVGARKTFLTTFGIYSLPIFLLHSGLFRLLHKTGWTISGTLPALLVSLLAALGVCFLFGNAAVDRCCRALLRFASRFLLPSKESK